MTCPFPATKAELVLRVPNNPAGYRQLGLDDAPLSDEARSDLLARYALTDGAKLAPLYAMLKGRYIFKTRHYLAILQACRRVGLSLSGDLYALERVLAEQPAPSPNIRSMLLREFLAADDLRKNNRAVVVAAMPKSASTYFCSVLAKTLGGPMTTPHNRNDALGVGFDLLDFLRAYHQGGVMHSHLDASDRVVSMAKLLEIRPVVQTRNVFDALASYMDHAAARFYAKSEFGELDDATKRRAVILRIGRHYIDMVASWSEAERQLPICWIDFDEVRSNIIDTVERVLVHTGLSADPERIRQVADELDPRRTGRSRFNKGRSGRGAMFSEEEKSWLRSLYAEYPRVDFSRIDPEWSPRPPRVRRPETVGRQAALATASG